MDNKSFETPTMGGTSPIPDLFDTEPISSPENKDGMGSDDVVSDDTGCAKSSAEPVEPAELATGVPDNRETENPKSDDTRLLHDGVAALSEQILSLEKLFNAKIMHSEHEKKIVDQMHRELQKYKDDMYAQLIRPILLDVISMRDSILKQVREYQSKPEGEQHIPLQVFETYAFDTEEILARNNIDFYSGEVNSDFLSTQQRAIKKVFTDNQSLHGKIAESIVDGYSYQGKTISPEKVAVYVYEPKQGEEAVDNEGEATQNG